MKELIKREIPEVGVSFVAKIEDGKVKAEASADLVKLVDLADAKVDAPMDLDKIVFGMLKESLKAL